MRRTLERAIGKPGTFVARCTVVGAAIRIDAGFDGRAWATCLKALRQPGTPRTRRSVAVRIYAATVAAGLVVAQFVKFAAGQGPSSRTRLDLRSLILEVEEPS
jgi:hypothetical protein